MRDLVRREDTRWHGIRLSPRILRKVFEIGEVLVPA